MPRGSKPGERRGGREVGTPNKATASMQQRLEQLGCDPIALQVLIVQNKLPCGVCRGTGRTRYTLNPPLEHCLCNDNTLGELGEKGCEWCSGSGQRAVGERECQSCHGSLFEACGPDLRSKTAATLTEYILPKRKALELTGGDGVALPVWQVVLPDVKEKK